MGDSRWSRRSRQIVPPHSCNVRKPTIRVNTYCTHRLSFFLTPHFQSFSKCPSSTSSSLILQGVALIKLKVKEQGRFPDGVILSDTRSLPYHQKIPSQKKITISHCSFASHVAKHEIRRQNRRVRSKRRMDST